MRDVDFLVEVDQHEDCHLKATFEAERALRSKQDQEEEPGGVWRHVGPQGGGLRLSCWRTERCSTKNHGLEVRVRFLSTRGQIQNISFLFEEHLMSAASPENV